MAKRVRLIVFTLADGTEKTVQSKTCSESYIRNLIADLRICVVKWEVI